MHLKQCHLFTRLPPLTICFKIIKKSKKMSGRDKIAKKSYNEEYKWELIPSHLIITDLNRHCYQLMRKKCFFSTSNVIKVNTFSLSHPSNTLSFYFSVLYSSIFIFFYFEGKFMYVLSNLFISTWSINFFENYK